MKRKISISKLLSYVILIIGSMFFLLPFIWMILTSIKPANEVMSMPLKWLPSKIMFQNYIDAYNSAPFKQYYINSIIVAVCVTAGELFTTILAAYAFSNINFKFKNILFTILIATMMVPGEVVLIPKYVILSDLGWINSYKALIIPWTASIFSIFLLRQSFISLPKDLYKAAKIDGCSDLKYLFKIMVPMSKPTIMSIIVLKVIGSWNSYMWPLIVTNTDEMRTLPVALAAFSSEAGVNYNTLMAASIMIILPIIIVYIVLQKYIIEGISRNGGNGGNSIKG